MKGTSPAPHQQVRYNKQRSYFTAAIATFKPVLIKLAAWLALAGIL